MAVDVRVDEREESGDVQSFVEFCFSGERGRPKSPFEKCVDDEVFVFTLSCRYKGSRDFTFFREVALVDPPVRMDDALLDTSEVDGRVVLLVFVAG